MNSTVLRKLIYQAVKEFAGRQAGGLRGGLNPGLAFRSEGEGNGHLLLGGVNALAAGALAGTAPVL